MSVFLSPSISDLLMEPLVFSGIYQEGRSPDCIPGVCFLQSSVSLRSQQKLLCLPGGNLPELPQWLQDWGKVLSNAVVVALHLVDIRENGTVRQDGAERPDPLVSCQSMPFPRVVPAASWWRCLLWGAWRLWNTQPITPTSVSACIYLSTSPDLAQAMNGQLFLHKGHFFSPKRSVKRFFFPAGWCVTRYSGGSSRGWSDCFDPLSPSCSLIIDSSKHHLCNLLNEMGLRSGSPIVSAKLYCSQQAKHVPAWHFLAGYLSSPLVITIVHLCY